MPVYITFDIDFFDPSLAPGTANILPNGGDYDSTFTFLADVLGGAQILGIDIVEANPAIDIRNKTSVLVNNLLMQLISLIRW
ncbi:MAG: arginase family protein [Prevotella sp.]